MDELPTGNTELSRDKRAISHIDLEDRERYMAGVMGITKIVAYDENGHMSHIPWLAVFTEQGIITRMVAEKAVIYYA